MLLGDLFNSGAMQTLELTAKFAGARQRQVMANIANIDTPNYIQRDLSPVRFEGALRRAVEERRKRGGDTGPLRIGSTKEMTTNARGEVVFTPTTASGNILAHDRNDRDVERLMQANAENAGVFRVAVDLLRSRYELIRTAVAERA